MQLEGGLCTTHEHAPETKFPIAVVTPSWAVIFPCTEISWVCPALCCSSKGHLTTGLSVLTAVGSSVSWLAELCFSPSRNSQGGEGKSLCKQEDVKGQVSPASVHWQSNMIYPENMDYETLLKDGFCMEASQSSKTCSLQPYLCRPTGTLWQLM